MMNTPANRSTRRAEARKTKNRKNGMVALSLLATTGLMSSYVAAFRTTASFAASQTCSDSDSDIKLDYAFGSSKNQVGFNFNNLTDLEVAIGEDTDIDGDESICVSITFDFETLVLTGTFDIYSAGNDAIDQVFINGNNVTLDAFTASDTILQIEPEVLNVSINEVTFSEGYSSGKGGAINSSANLTITDSTFVGNGADEGGGAIYSDGDITISDSSFQRNSTGAGNGGAILSEVELGSFIGTLDRDGEALVSQDILASNRRADYNVDGFVVDEPTVNVSSTSFIGNIAERGGAISAPYHFAYVDYSNASTAGLDPDIAQSTSSGSSEVNISNDSRFDLNVASGEGGAIQAVSVDVRDSIFNKNSAADGGAIYTVSDNDFYGYENTEVRFSVFTQNTADNDDGDGSGGAIFTSNGIEIYDSTFQSNKAGDDGGALSGDSFMRVERSTFNRNESDTGVGGAIQAGDYLNVSWSTFTDNVADNDGGAVEADDNAFVQDSTFSGNRAWDDGGALEMGYGDVEGSTFNNNFAGDDGGAIAWDSDTSTISNSTFVMNQANNQGGAIENEYDGDGGSRLSFNTFVNNFSEVPTDEELEANTDEVATNDVVRLDGGEAIFSYEGMNLTGNIFANEFDLPAGPTSSTVSTRSQIQYRFGDAGSVDNYNLSTGEGFYFRSPESEKVRFEDLDLDESLGQNYGRTRTIALGSVDSIAADFVPANAQFISLVTRGGPEGYKPRDQRGVVREGALDAGAFEIGDRPNNDNTNNDNVGAGLSFVQAPPFLVLDSNPIRTRAGKITKVTGVNLTRVTEVFVNGIKVEITSKAGSSIRFRAPAGQTGLVNVRFVGGGYEFTLSKGLNFGAATEVSGTNAKTFIPGFGANSTKLTRPMKKAIRAFINANPDLTTVTCKGFTSAPATDQDLVLAQQRGKVTCDFIKKINPELEVVTLKGAHTNTPGQQVRRVRLVME